MRVGIHLAALIALASGLALARVGPGASEARGGGSLTSAAAAAEARPSARVGAYYFGGWAAPLSSFHFAGLLYGPFSSWQPLSGWQDNTPASLESELRYAHGAGIDFFIFDYYWGSETTADDRWLNVPLGIYRGLRDHHGVRYALQYTNDVERYWIPPDRWASVVDQWAATYFQDPDYVRIEGKPLLVIHDPDRFARSLGGADKINAAIDLLQAAARAHGLPGVFLVGDFYVGDSKPPDAAWMFTGQHFDAVSQYGYPAAVGPRDGPVPYAELVAAGERNWDSLAVTSGLPYIPDITAGWDGRPANEAVAGHLWWFVRTPEQVAAFVADAVTWSFEHPTEIVEPAAARPLVFVEAWNELQEGSFLIPTVADGFAYAEALSRALGAAWTGPRHTLMVTVRGAGGTVKSRPTGISCPRTCRASFDEGRRVALTATPRRTFTFRSWSGDCRGQSPTCTLLIKADRTARALFSRRR